MPAITTEHGPALDDWLDADRDMPTDATLTLRRAGTFTLRVRGDRHCGIYPEGAPPEVPCAYELRLRCRADSLDAHGFIVEQIGIDRFFNALPRTGLSCEKLVVRCARLLYRKIKLENPGCKVLGLALTISPRPANAPGEAGVTFEWDFDAARAHAARRN